MSDKINFGASTSHFVPLACNITWKRERKKSSLKFWFSSSCAEIFWKKVVFMHQNTWIERVLLQTVLFVCFWWHQDSCNSYLHAWFICNQNCFHVVACYAGLAVTLGCLMVLVLSWISSMFTAFCPGVVQCGLCAILFCFLTSDVYIVSSGSVNHLCLLRYTQFPYIHINSSP